MGTTSRHATIALLQYKRVVVNKGHRFFLVPSFFFDTIMFMFMFTFTFTTICNTGTEDCTLHNQTTWAWDGSYNGHARARVPPPAHVPHHSPSAHPKGRGEVHHWLPTPTFRLKVPKEVGPPGVWVACRVHGKAQKGHGLVGRTAQSQM